MSAPVESKVEQFKEEYGDKSELHPVVDSLGGIHHFDLLTFLRTPVAYAQFREKGNLTGGRIVEYVKSPGDRTPLRRERLYAINHVRLYGAQVDYQQGDHFVRWSLIYDEWAERDAPSHALDLEFQTSEDSKGAIAIFQYRAGYNFPERMTLPLGEIASLAQNPLRDRSDFDPQNSISVRRKRDFRDSSVIETHIFDDRVGPSAKVGIFYPWDNEFSHPTLKHTFNFDTRGDLYLVSRKDRTTGEIWQFSVPEMNFLVMHRLIIGSWREYASIRQRFPAHFDSQA